MAAKRDLLYEQHQLERSQQQQQLSSTQLQQLKPVLLQKLYDQDIQRQRQMNNNYHNEQVPQYTPHSNSNDILVNINDESERDATVIHTEQPSHHRNNANQPQNPFADNV